MKNNLLKCIYKRTIGVLALALIVCSTVNAQSDNEEVDYVQSIFGMEKKVAMAEFLELEMDASFWTLYDSYEAERKELGKKRLGLLEKYSNNYVDMQDDVSDILIKDMQTQKKSLDKLIDQYYKKIKKTSGSKVAAQFYQFENYVLSAVRFKIFENIPLIGELE